MEPTVDDLVAWNFRHLREERRWSQEALAHRVNEKVGYAWTRDHVRAIERATHRLLLAEAVALAQVFDVGLAEFLIAPSAAWFRVGPALRASNLDGLCTRSGRPGGARAARPSQPPAPGLPLAERRAAKALGVAAEAVAETAVKLWRRGLTQERDRRVAELVRKDAEGWIGKYTMARAQQALRGHVTRELVAELGATLKRRM